MKVILRVDRDNPEREPIDRAVEKLRSGEFVVAPTETRYGLLARSDDQATLERLFLLKQRDIKQPTALLVADAARLGELGDITTSARRLIDRMLPGPLTLVLRARRNWPPPRVISGKIGLRWSSAAVIDSLIHELDFPLTATSANISGQSSPDGVEEIREMFGDEIGLYLDSGPLSGAPSTVVDCSGERPVVLRRGGITAEQIESVISSDD